MTLTRMFPLAVTSLALSASLASAQTAIAETDPATFGAVVNSLTGAMSEQTAPSSGPRLDRTRAGIVVARAASSGTLASEPQPSISRRRGVPQMIIGGAAILGGAIVGGDAGAIVSLAGLGFGLYGLYLYLQ